MRKQTNIKMFLSTGKESIFCKMGVSIMCHRLFLGSVVLIIGLVATSVSHAAKRLEQSPFSLESAVIEQNSATTLFSEQSVNRSVFSLPSEDGKEPVSSTEKITSLFSLPAEENEQMPDEIPGSRTLTALELQQKGTAFAKEGKLEDARILLARSLVKDPTNPCTLNNMGLVMRRLGRLNEAMRAYQSALEIDDSYALTWKNLGILLEKQDKKELAVKAYQKYCLLAPSAADFEKVNARASWLSEKNKSTAVDSY